MKKIILPLLVVAALASCSNNDDNSNDNTLHGTWKLTSMTLPFGLDFNNDGTAGTDLMAETGCMDNSTISFGPDNIATLNMQGIDIGEDDNGNYVVTCIDAETETHPYTVAEDTITLTVDGNEVVFVKSGNTLTASMQGSTMVFIKQ